MPEAHEWITIPETPEMLAYAEAEAARLHALYDDNPPPSQENFTPDRELKGAVGHWAFNHWLNTLGIRYAPPERNAWGKGDKTDTFIYGYGKVEVKTAASGPEERALYGAHQTHRRFRDVVFLRWKPGSHVWIWGWMPRDDFFARAQYAEKDSYLPSKDGPWKVKGSCHYVPVEMLRPPLELIRQIPREANAYVR